MSIGQNLLQVPSQVHGRSQPTPQVWVRQMSINDHKCYIQPVAEEEERDTEEPTE